MALLKSAFRKDFDLGTNIQKRFNFNSKMAFVYSHGKNKFGIRESKKKANNSIARMSFS